MEDSSFKFGIIRYTSMEKSNILTISELCEIAGVSRSGYYAWLSSERKRAARDQFTCGYLHDFDDYGMAWQSLAVCMSVSILYTALLCHGVYPGTLSHRLDCRVHLSFRSVCGGDVDV